MTYQYKNIFFITIFQIVFLGALYFLFFQSNEDIFNKNTENQKERGRVLDEIFKESTKHVDRSGEKPLRDFDFD